MNSTNKIPMHRIWLSLLLVVLLSACGDDHSDHGTNGHGHGHDEAAEAEPEKGPHRGRLFKAGNFTLELAIFETGVPPEFRAWATNNGNALSPDNVKLNIKLTRLGDKIDDINFAPQGDALRGDTVIYEPHSFAITINAAHNGVTHTWQYDSFEGRTRIETTVAEALAIGTAVAGSVVMQKTISVYGQIAPNSEQLRSITARFDGAIQSVLVSQGEQVRKGQKLATIESNESLQRFTITSPISGVISLRDANVGEQTNSRQLFTIMDSRSVWAELSVFPTDLAQVKMGASVTITDTTSGYQAKGKVSRINPLAEADQSVKVRVVLDNKKGQLRPGRHISANITVGEHTAALAVKRSGLQAFRDFTVVYAQIGEEYEVRMLELGLQAGEWAEVLGGLEPGSRYVSENSYVIKADIEKSGAAHDH
ncbi:MAG: efflux RND transporter periplasmic adaptor subunit [Gammaproteobacteria bacterium]|nr:efflux RND transporter periplasmic adaptor subunit [Gammaproteobacteria bacterium]